MSTPEEQIAHNIEVLGSRWQRTPRQFYMQKAIGKGKGGSSGIPRQVRVQTGHHSFALSSLDDKLPNNMAICATMNTICSLGEKTNTTGFPEFEPGSC